MWLFDFMNQQLLFTHPYFVLDFFRLVFFFYGVLTKFSYIQHHGCKDVIHKVKAYGISEDGIPQHKKVLHRKLSPEQKSQPPSGNIKIAFFSCSLLSKTYYHNDTKVIYLFHLFHSEVQGFVTEHCNKLQPK